MKGEAMAHETWVQAEDVRMYIPPQPGDNKRYLAISGLTEITGQTPGPGELNPKLADPNSSIWFAVKMFTNMFGIGGPGGSVPFGRMRVLGAGGIFTVPFELLDIPKHAREGLLRKMEPHVPYTAAPVVFRDWKAPRKPGMFGIPAGHGEHIPFDPRKIYLHGLTELLGEVGLLVRRDGETLGRVRYNLPGNLSDFNDKLDEDIVAEWKTAYTEVPPIAGEADVYLENLPHALYIEDLDMAVHNVFMVMEPDLAALDCMFKVSLDLHLPEGAKLAFLDLESTDSGHALNRRIGTMLIPGWNSGEIGLVSFTNGAFDESYPLFHIRDEEYDQPGGAKDIGNEAFDWFWYLLREGHS